jgi:hypothetical protein
MSRNPCGDSSSLLSWHARQVPLRIDYNALHLCVNVKLDEQVQDPALLQLQASR